MLSKEFGINTIETGDPKPTYESLKAGEIFKCLLEVVNDNYTPTAQDNIVELTMPINVHLKQSIDIDELEREVTKLVNEFSKNSTLLLIKKTSEKCVNCDYFLEMRISGKAISKLAAVATCYSLTKVFAKISNLITPMKY